MFLIGTNSFCNKRVWRQVDRQSSGRPKVTDDSKLYEWFTRSHTLYDLLTVHVGTFAYPCPIFSPPLLQEISYLELN